MSNSVLIVGAGPVGLLLASELTKYGISVRIIDKEITGSKYSKALSVNAATLKVFHGLGIADSIIKKGKSIKDVQIFYNKKRTAHINKRYLKTIYNYYLSIPQPETEKCLENLLNTQGVFVEYQKEFINLKQSVQSVFVEEKDIKTNEIVTRHYDYVIGCDGGQSRVRECLNIPFTGKDYNMHFVMGDVFFFEQKNLNETSYHIMDDGFMIMLPMSNGLTRLVIKKDNLLPSPRPEPSLQDLQIDLDYFYQSKLTIKKLIWASSAQFFNRFAKTLHLNHVFLAGDAFHLFSPIGGQGMNTGLQDAMNLAWKLAYFIKGTGTLDLLATYQIERMFVVEKLLCSTDLNTDLISNNDLENLKRSLFIPSLSNREYYRNQLPFEFSGLVADYSSGEDTLKGKHVPYFPIKNLISGIVSTYDLASLGKIVLFSLKKVNLGNEYNSKIINVICDDDNLTLIEGLKIKENIVCLIRPDGYIGYHGNKEGLITYLNRILKCKKNSSFNNEKKGKR